MIAYTTLGVSDFERGKHFYSTLLGLIGAECVLGNERIALFGTSLDNPMLAVCIPYNEEAASPGNGTMVAIRAGSHEACDALYAKAIELGATCDGPPGERMPGFFTGPMCLIPMVTSCAFARWARTDGAPSPLSLIRQHRLHRS